MDCESLTLKKHSCKKLIGLGGIYNGASHNDLLALSLTKQEQCSLLTGDSRLRIAAKAEQIEVHGTLWLMRQLIEERLITIERAEQAYQDMKMNNEDFRGLLLKNKLRNLRNNYSAGEC
jgi:hypothetical protein